VIVSFVSFGNLRVLLFVVVIFFVDVFIRCLGFGFDAFSFNSFNLLLDVISSPYFPSVRIRLFVFEDEGGGIAC
jgi:hypothetical protein